MIGAGGLAKDKVAAIRWLALGAKQGHPPSQALLGHMLFVGDGVPSQRARGLMWLERAKDGASSTKDQWISQLYHRDFQAAADGDRRTAAAMYGAPANRMQPMPLGSSTASFLRPFGIPQVDPLSPAAQ